MEWKNWFGRGPETKPDEEEKKPGEQDNIEQLPTDAATNVEGEKRTEEEKPEQEREAA